MQDDKYILALKDIAKIISEDEERFNRDNVLGQVYDRIVCLDNAEIS